MFVPSEDTSCDNIEAFLHDVTAPFLLVQSSFCSGLVAGAAASAGLIWTSLQGVFRPWSSADSGGVLRACVRNWFAWLLEPERAERRDLLSLGVWACSHFCNHCYSLELWRCCKKPVTWLIPDCSSPREASFLPSQSPTEGHLRYELARVTITWRTCVTPSKPLSCV